MSVGQAIEMATAEGKPVLVLDGAWFSDFEGFVREFDKLLGGDVWNGTLDAFNDILRGGFGTPDGGFVLRWERSELSRAALGHDATARWLQGVLVTCHPMNREGVRARLQAARAGVGPTLFDKLIEIIETHGPGGAEADDSVDLELR